MHHQLSKGIVGGLDFVEGVQQPKLDKLHIRLLEVGRIDRSHNSSPILCRLLGKSAVVLVVVRPFFIGEIGQI